MEHLLSSKEIPIGLGMALAENTDAMAYFTSLSRDERSRVIERTHSFKSKREMQEYVNSFFKVYGDK